jgi:trehalose synthase
MFIHDPQPVGLIDRRRPGDRKWIWRCHIDVSSPCPDVWSFLQRYVRRYDALIFSVDDFSKSLPLPQYTVPPSIDPLAEKNRTLTDAEVREVLERHQLDPARPILTQISRFDRLKDPLGVVQAYRLVRRHQDCQLVLAGGGADDDPEGAEVLHEVREAAGSDPDIHILELPLFSDHEINALVRGSTVVMQKSIKEGFGLTVSEALWKRKAVVAGRVGGIRLQIRDGHSGFLVDSPELAARRVIRLLEDPELRRLMGERGHRHVKRNFLITRHMADYLRVAHLVLQQSSRARVSVPATVQTARAACA